MEAEEAGGGVIILIFLQFCSIVTTIVTDLLLQLHPEQRGRAAR